MEILRTVNLTKTYGKGITEVEALKETNISIQKGMFVAIVGASGSGKSTLLHLLGGLENPSSGEVIIEGQSLSQLSEHHLSIYRRRKFGFIFQQFNLIPVLTAEENIVLPILLDNKVVDKEYINELIQFLGLSDRRHHLPNALSGGQQQRVAIARALANKPSIIFADEPTGNLDSKVSLEVLDLLRQSIKKFNQTLIMITHDVEVSKFADRIITIQDGLALQVGEVQQ
ncbi:ABC transporter ATP-binding protein [Bacillus sp. 31A1R]|uniref:ABC transporter ATP-binding protein n=1 Tax=Robertmurraya mangrovi TaxID=3098077 RepID=A0ABU5IW02_9BACI|nr:ABC transporter ATP-binding protein [Bacillus sp. 31A1R]MDZ5471334.1 ABC transporter ATP-binding protein [Bacillus sp. 31A1R]